MKILVIDNYDSFTYILVNYLRELSGLEIDVFRNDKIDLDEIGKYDKILISPGPGVPHEAGITIDLIKRWAPQKSILGVCLGCQAIAESYGGEIFNLESVYHGVATNMSVKDSSDRLFREIPENFLAGRYHSWVIKEENLPSDIKITARDDKGLIMAVTHKKYDLKGVQFHPESVLTKHGKKMIANWLDIG
ncbi:MAG: aminodeoxychorismate/anthranilate synthase component II [Bacteroidales bacterium]|nr:aminodeoxychorismate/anthranilate synthase component II [Bacteroidales bacterium]